MDIESRLREVEEWKQSWQQPCGFVYYCVNEGGVTTFHRRAVEKGDDKALRAISSTPNFVFFVEDSEGREYVTQNKESIKEAFLKLAFSLNWGGDALSEIRRTKVAEGVEMVTSEGSTSEGKRTVAIGLEGPGVDKLLGRTNATAIDDLDFGDTKLGQPSCSVDGPCESCQ